MMTEFQFIGELSL